MRYLIYSISEFEYKISYVLLKISDILCKISDIYLVLFHLEDIIYYRRYLNCENWISAIL